MKITKEDLLKMAKAARRLVTIHLHPKPHNDRRKRRKNTRQTERSAALKDQDPLK